jgi:hypothetical protein
MPGYDFMMLDKVPLPVFARCHEKKGMTERSTKRLMKQCIVYAVHASHSVPVKVHMFTKDSSR